jgi:hypothetical protein
MTLPVPDKWKPRPEGALCDYCIPYMDKKVAEPATIYCRGCKRNFCDICLECH